MTPQVGRPVQYTGTMNSIAGTYPAVIFRNIVGETADLLVSNAYPSGTTPDVYFRVKAAVPRDTAHGANTWDYIPD